MKLYKGTFVKKNNELRDMVFAKLNEIDDVNSNFIAGKIIGSGLPKHYPEGIELVWDLEASNGNGDFRCFNWNTIIKPVDEIEVENNLFDD